VITGVAFVPSTPLLVPAVGAGASHELDHVREGCRSALAQVSTPSTERIVIIGGGARNRVHIKGSGTLRGFGVTFDVDLHLDLDATVPPILVVRLPLSLTLGAWLLEQAGWSGERLAVEIDMTADEAGAKFHRDLVAIHPFTNGNGRHARAAVDLLMLSVGEPPFTWGGGADLADNSNIRSSYIAALRAADGGDYAPLLAFVRS